MVCPNSSTLNTTPLAYTKRIAVHRSDSNQLIFLNHSPLPVLSLPISISSTDSYHNHIPDSSSDRSPGSPSFSQSPSSDQLGNKSSTIPASIVGSSLGSLQPLLPSPGDSPVASVGLSSLKFALKKLKFRKAPQKLSNTASSGLVSSNQSVCDSTSSLSNSVSTSSSIGTFVDATESLVSPRTAVSLGGFTGSHSFGSGLSSLPVSLRPSSSFNKTSTLTDKSLNLGIVGPIVNLHSTANPKASAVQLTVNDNIPLDRQRRRNKNARLHCKIKQLETGCVKDYASLRQFEKRIAKTFKEALILKRQFIDQGKKNAELLLEAQRKFALADQTALKFRDKSNDYQRTNNLQLITGLQHCNPRDIVHFIVYQTKNSYLYPPKPDPNKKPYIPGSSELKQKKTRWQRARDWRRFVD